MLEENPWYVGVRKGQYAGHEKNIFQCSEPPTPSSHPDLDYVVGPFESKEKAVEYGAHERNHTGMFHPFPGHPR